MRQILYTSDGFGWMRDQPWVKVQKQKIADYCRVNNIELRIISDNNRYLLRLMDIFNDWSVPYLCSIAALYDFVNNTHCKDKVFYWMHLDMVIENEHVDIFDYLSVKDDTIYMTYCWDKLDYRSESFDEWQMKKATMLIEYCKHLGIEMSLDDDHIVSFITGFIACNLTAATKLIKLIEKYSLIGKRHDYPIVDETVLEVIHILALRNDLDLKFGDANDVLKPEFDQLPVVERPDSHCGHEIAFSHFHGNDTHEILDYYASRQ